MKIASKALIFYLSLILLLGAYVWAYRVYFLTPVDMTYLNDLYDHSQWSVPNSIRTIGDDGRYEIAAYRLLHGGKLYEVAPEVPPLGKYVIGLSLQYFKNATVFAVPFAIASVVLFFLLTKYFFQTPNKRYFATILFVLSPQIVNNIARVTLDLPQMSMLLAHTLFLFNAIKSNSQKKMWIWSIVSGIALGSFVSFKFGIFLLPIIITDSYLLYKNKKLPLLVPLIILTPAIYATSTLQFFIQGGSFSEWLSSQKWIVNFYRQSNSGFVPFMVIMTMATSLYRGWWDSGWEMTNEWSILMPIGIGIITHALYKKYKLKIHADAESTYLFAYCVLTVLLLSVIAFWPRYLVLIMPFLIIAIVRFFPLVKYTKYIAITATMLVIFQAGNLLYPQPSEFTSSLEMNLKNATYQEVYGMLTVESQKTTNRDLFWRELLELDNQLHVQSKQVAITYPWVWPWQNTVQATSKIQYATSIGELEHSKKISLIRQNNVWKLSWAWDIMLPNYEPADSVEVKIDSTKDQQILPFVYITPNKVANETTLVYDVAEITDQKRYIVIKKYLENTPADWAAPIGFVKPQYDPGQFRKISTDSAVTIKQLPKFEKPTGQSGIIALQKKNGKRYVLLYNENKE